MPAFLTVIRPLAVNKLKMAAGQWEQSLQEYARTVAADAEPSDVNKVQKKLDSARVKLAKEESGASPKH